MEPTSKIRQAPTLNMQPVKAAAKQASKKEYYYPVMNLGCQKKGMKHRRRWANHQMLVQRLRYCCHLSGEDMTDTEEAFEPPVLFNEPRRTIWDMLREDPEALEMYLNCQDVTPDENHKHIGKRQMWKSKNYKSDVQHALKPLKKLMKGYPLKFYETLSDFEKLYLDFNSPKSPESPINLSDWTVLGDTSDVVQPHISNTGISLHSSETETETAWTCMYQNGQETWRPLSDCGEVKHPKYDMSNLPPSIQRAIQRASGKDHDIGPPVLLVFGLRFHERQIGLGLASVFNLHSGAYHLYSEESSPSVLVVRPMKHRQAISQLPHSIVECI
eukprot:Platyproteum_vivax@DN1711_c0_g1_i1.p1